MMAVDPICGMEVDESKPGFSLEHEGETVHFCGKHCMDKYAKQNELKPDVKYCDSCVGVPWYRQKIVTVSFLFALVLAASYLVESLNPLYDNIILYVGIIWWAVIIGFVIGGVIDYYVPREYMSKVLAGKGKRTLLHATLLGFLMSACSHGLLAISIQLYKKGASIPAVIAFLLASPWANLTYTLLLFSLFGTKALLIIFSAIIIALTTGYAYQILDGRGKIEENPHTVVVDEGFSIRGDVTRRLRQAKLTRESVSKAVAGIGAGSWSLASMVLWWILVGVLAAALVGTYVPSHMFMQYVGPTVLGLFITLIAATIIEVCSEGSSPIAFEIFRQTGAFGNSFVFLMAGVATDYTEIGILWTNIGKRTALWLPVIAGPQIVLLGFLFNLLA